MATIKDFWTKHVEIGPLGFQACPRLECVDGFSMSVQAGETHYCSPRENDPSGDYYEWEVGFPSVKDEALMPFVEDAERPTETVYGYVPTSVIDSVINSHAGLKGAAPRRQRA